MIASLRGGLLHRDGMVRLAQVGGGRQLLPYAEVIQQGIPEDIIWVGLHPSLDNLDAVDLFRSCCGPNTFVVLHDPLDSSDRLFPSVGLPDEELLPLA